MIGLATNTYKFYLLDSETLSIIFESQFDFAFEVFLSPDVAIIKEVSRDYQLVLNIDEN
jgi:hypothetical protein